MTDEPAITWHWLEPEEYWVCRADDGRYGFVLRWIPDVAYQEPGPREAIEQRVLRGHRDFVAEQALAEDGPDG